MQNKISKRQAFYMALSILVAVSIWIFVDLNDARTATVVAREIPIEYVGEDEVLAERGLMLMEEGTDTMVDLELTGSRWDIARLDKSKIRIQVDLKDVDSVGTQSVSYRIVYPDRNFNNVIKVSDADPFSATINVGDLYSRTIGVRCEIQGEIAEGFSAGKIELSPEELEVRGQRELIDPISYAKVTLNLNQAEATVSQLLDFEFYDSKGHVIHKKGIHATADQIHVTLPVNVTKELRLTMDFVETPGAQLDNVKYEIKPSTITVSGDAAKLKDVDTIILDQFQLLSLGTSGTGEQHHNYAITVPEGCENLSGVTRASLKISFRDMTQKTMQISNFHYQNQPEGKEIELLTQALEVKLFGPQSVVDGIQPEDLTATIDLADLSVAAGIYTVPVDIQVQGTDRVGIAGTYQVRLSLREAEQEPPMEHENHPPQEE